MPGHLQPIDMACVILVGGDGRFFVQQRLPEDIWGGLWEFPGGVIEPGEDARAAACREMAEETGLEVVLGRSLAPVELVDGGYRVTLTAFLAAPLRKLQEPLLTAAASCRWCHGPELAALSLAPLHAMLLPQLPGAA